MQFPGATDIEGLLDDVTFPQAAVARYEPPTTVCDDPAQAARDAVRDLPLASVPSGGTVAVGVGSRGIADIVPIVREVVAELQERGFAPVVIPAMGSHGGATASGQRETLAELGITPATIGCEIDAGMSTSVVGRAGDGPVHVAAAATEADGVIVVNRIKQHTNFSGRIESGLCKMGAVGLGKQPGAQTVHRRAFRDGHVTAILDTFETVCEAIPLVGGIAIVENFYDETALVEGVPVGSLPDRETSLLQIARDELPTLPIDSIDVLIVDRIGKDVSGTGMDTNVVGRNDVLGASTMEGPDVDRIVVRGLTAATGGNGNGIGLADITTVEVLESIDLTKTYANALTSSSLRRVHLPIAMPDDRSAISLAATSAGPYDPETVRLVWIRDTGHLSAFAVSPAVAEGLRDHSDITLGDFQSIETESGSIERPRFPFDE